MKVFISWSKPRSQAVAEALGPWLKHVVQSVDYWISTDMERGVRWLSEINRNLDEHSFGIVCVTPENVEERWLNFESGALSKHLGIEGRVIPVLFDFKSPGALKDPLGQFNACLATKDGLWAVIEMINKRAEFSLKDADLDVSFKTWWPKLETELARIQQLPAQTPEPRPDDDKAEETLSLVREIYRTLSSTPIASGETPSDDLNTSKVESRARAILTVNLRAVGMEGARVALMGPGELLVVFPKDPSRFVRLALRAAERDLLERLPSISSVLFVSKLPAESG